MAFIKSDNRMRLKRIFAVFVKTPFKFIPLAAVALNAGENKLFFAPFRWKILQLLEREGKVGRKHGCRPSVYRYWQKRYQIENQHAVAESLEYLNKTTASPSFAYIVEPEANFFATCSTINSLRHQSYKNIEIIIRNNATRPLRSRLLQNVAGNMAHIVGKNENIKAYLDKASFVLDISPGDKLSQQALLEIGLYMERSDRSWDIAYFDEDVQSSFGRCRFPFFKPDYSPLYNSKVNYISGACVYKAGLFPPWKDKCLKDDICLQIPESLRREKILHIPEVLLHKREPRAISSMGKKDYQYLIINQADSAKDNALVSIIIPIKDNVSYLNQCISSILDKSQSDQVQIIVVNNKSEKQETLDYLKKLSENDRFRILEYPYDFNYSAINNFAAREAEGQYLVFLNNDTTIISAEWLKHMKYWLSKPLIGCVGVKLLYSDQTIQHVGIIVGASMGACHYNVGDLQEDYGYFGINTFPREVSAVTAACMGVRKDNFVNVGGFDEKIPVAFNDIELCLRMMNAGYVNILDPRIQLFHYESRTRGRDDDIFKLTRDRKERNCLVKNSMTDIRFDAYYNPNLSLNNTYCLSFPPRTVSMIKSYEMKLKRLVVLVGSIQRYGSALEAIMKEHERLLKGQGYSIIWGVDIKCNVTTKGDTPFHLVKNEWDAMDMIRKMSTAYVIVYSEPYQKIAWMMPREIKVFYFHGKTGWTEQKGTTMELSVLDREAAETYAYPIVSIEEFFAHTRSC